MEGRREDKEKIETQHEALSFTLSVAAALMKSSATDFPVLEVIKTSKQPLCCPSLPPFPPNKADLSGKRCRPSPHPPGAESSSLADAPLRCPTAIKTIVEFYQRQMGENVDAMLTTQ